MEGIARDDDIEARALRADIEGSAAPQRRSGRSDREPSYSLGRLVRGTGAGGGWWKGERCGHRHSGIG